MNPFSYAIVHEVQEAVNAYQGAEHPLFIAGATDVLQLLQEDILHPGTLIDIGRLPLTHVRLTPKGGHIGALARLSDVADHPDVQRWCPLLARALSETASPQIRNTATIGGNLLQRTRCLYFRDAASPCNKRVRGSGCPAQQGANRMNAILGVSDQCNAAYPGDMATALVALDAYVEIHGPEGERTIRVADLYRVPADDPPHDWTLRDGEIITGIVLPESRFAAHSAYVKVRDRASFEWALASCAVGLEMQGQTVLSAGIAAGSVGTTPWGLPEVEKALVGRVLDDATAHVAAQLSVQGAHASGENSFKMKLLPRVVEHAILAAGGLQ